MGHATFEIDPRLAALLGATYRSTEQAIKELIDNAWDADAKKVFINLPDPMTADPVRIEDDGVGMTEAQVRREYLRVARDRRAVKGDRTSGERRLVKGRKGIGKFAGLTVANLMTVSTRARGSKTTLIIPRSELLTASKDLESFRLEISSERCDLSEQGTTVTLSQLHQNLAFPSVERLKTLIISEYARENNFLVVVNGSTVTVSDIPGETAIDSALLPEVGPVHGKFAIARPKHKIRQPGISIRVSGKIIGDPSFFGLDDDPEIPRSLLKRLYGEVEADGLSEDVTADWGAVIENSKGYLAVQEWIQATVRKHLNETCQREINLSKARLKLEADRRLQSLPENRRQFAEKFIERIMQRFYGEPEDRLKPIISVALDALERDEYRAVLETISDTNKADVYQFAQALSEFGLLEMSLIAQQAAHRLKFLNFVENLVLNDNTTEAVVHKALQTNFWIFGPQFALVSSNKTLANLIEQYTGTKFAGDRASRRPDLLLVNRIGRSHLLIEFKRPNHTITRDDVNQALKYRDDLASRFASLDVLLIGRDKDESMDSKPPQDVRIQSYIELISNARVDLEWLLSNLTSADILKSAEHQLPR